MLVKISVFDVTGGPINDCIVHRLSNNGAIIDSFSTSGNESSFDWTDNNVLYLKVAHADYFEEELMVSPNASFSSNSTCRIIKTTIIEIAFTLSQIREAPTIYIPTDKLDRMIDPLNAILLQSEQSYDYKNLFFGELKFRILGYPILDNPNGQEWQRLRHIEYTSNPSVTGRFRWVEYRIRNKIYIVAIWAPKNYNEITHKDSIDYFIHYTPTTAGKPEYILNKGQKPPYGLQDVYDEEIKAYVRVAQPFVELGYRYMFNVHFLVYQLIAAKKNAVMVLPINNHGDWEPFFGKDAVYKCLKEISHYLHKTSLLTSQYRDRPTGTFNAIQFQKPIPDIENVIVGANSEGYMRLKSLFQNPKNSNNEKQFNDRWKEIWDLDCAIAPYGGFDEFLKNLKLWFIPGRHFRIFHSADTSSNWRPKNLEPLFGNGILNPPTGKPIQGKVKKIDKKTQQVVEIEVRGEEYHHINGDWSAVTFSNGYINADASHDKSARPEFIADAHHFVPNIGAGYSASKSVFS
jgi:hypothetical protein